MLEFTIIYYSLLRVALRSAGYWAALASLGCTGFLRFLRRTPPSFWAWEFLGFTVYRDLGLGFRVLQV